ncbi:transposase family protein [Streptomyces sp. NPDC004270]
MVALVYLREHTTLAKIAAGFGISESTAPLTPARSSDWSPTVRRFC